MGADYTPGRAARKLNFSRAVSEHLRAVLKHSRGTLEHLRGMFARVRA
jgi:hypothetical protein